MVARKGKDVLLKLGDGATPTENFVTVGGLRTTRLRLNRQLVDATNVASGAWRVGVSSAGITALQVQGEGIFTNSAAEEGVRAVALSGATQNFELLFGNSQKLTGSFIVTAYERAGTLRDAEQFSVTLESAGEVVYTTI